MRSLRFLAMLFLLVSAIAGCEGGPGEASVRADVAKSLTAIFGEDAFHVVDFRRQGHSPALDGREVVYFKARLAVARDLDLAAWQGPNASVLAAALGAAPKGVFGIQSKGNRAGDVIAAFGSATYRRTDKGWEFEPAAPPIAMKQAGTPPAGIEPPTPLRNFASAVESSLGALPRATATEVVEAELASAQRRIEARLARLRQGHAVASGPVQGEYWRFVQAVAGTVRPGALLNVPTAGSVENIRLFEEQLVDFAVIQSDVAANAIGTIRDMRAIAALFPEPVHVIVPQQSAIARIADLAERRVATGAVGSGSRIDALALIAAAEIPLERVPLETAADATAALTLMGAGKADAVIFTIASPATQIREYAARHPVRLIPIEGQLRERMREGRSSLVSLSLPPGLYAGQLQPIPTVAPTAILVARGSVPADTVALVLRTVFDQTDYGRGGSIQGLLVRRDSARRGLPIPLHPAAAAFYEQ